ncbi:MAG: oligopeptide transporter, OPT family [Legionellaceae bacterium]|nr:oligopeptide transporter, OPT family [Legionellaceae bacterium]
MTKPFISADSNVAELTIRCILLSIFLTVILAVSNAYLALKLGILTSASIPAAIISMGILRLFKNATILENNAVQTAASAGEAVAGGIVYTIPALIIIEYWHHFDYLTNFLIAASGGILGVLFSIPLRRVLVHDDALQFPEGRAIAEVLKSSSEKVGLGDIVYGSLIGGVLELVQVGFKVVANSWNHWFTIKRSIVCVGAGFSATMLGAGYLVGYDMACSIFIGAVMAWLVALPVASQFFPEFLLHNTTANAGSLLWTSELRYFGIGAMLFAGVWTFIKLIRPLSHSMRLSLSKFSTKKQGNVQLLRTDRDIPLPFILVSVVLMAGVLFAFFHYIFPVEQVGFSAKLTTGIVCGAVMYVLVIGFLFSVITAYFSGMVGVTASPGSSVVIAGILFAAWLLLRAISSFVPLPLSPGQIASAEAIIIIIASVVTGIAAIANDNSQDLKVGQLVGATPWKQQLMLLLGVIVSALVIPPVMQMLFDVYGIAGVMPHAGMDASQSLPAPTAVLLAAITGAVFRNNLPWMMMFAGACFIFTLIVCNHVFKWQRFIRLSILGVAIGMYLPITSSFPLFLGGMIAWFVQKRLNQQALKKTAENQRKQIGTRVACGLVAGSALVDVLLAIPFSMLHSPDAWRLVSEHWENTYGVYLSGLITLLLAAWIIRRVTAEGSPGL